jgi:hypothetical protein
MEKQLSKLTGLVEQAFLQGQSLGDLVNGDEMADNVLSQTGRKDNTASAVSGEFPCLLWLSTCFLFYCEYVHV